MNWKSFTHNGIGDSHDCYFQYLRVVADNAFYFQGVYLFSAPVDHIFLTVQNMNKAFLIALADISRMKPTIDDRFLRGHGVLQIT